MIEILAAAAEPNAGWGKLTALVVTGGAFWVGTSIYKRVKGIDVGVKTQVSAGSDPSCEPSRGGAPVKAPGLDEMVRAQLGSRSSSQIIRTAQDRFKVSRSTAKRALRRVKSAP